MQRRSMNPQPAPASSSLHLAADQTTPSTSSNSQSWTHLQSPTKSKSPTVNHSITTATFLLHPPSFLCYPIKHKSRPVLDPTRLPSSSSTSPSETVLGISTTTLFITMILREALDQDPHLRTSPYGFRFLCWDLSKVRIGFRSKISPL